MSLNILCASIKYHLIIYLFIPSASSTNLVPRSSLSAKTTGKNTVTILKCLNDHQPKNPKLHSNMRKRLSYFISSSTLNASIESILHGSHNITHHSSSIKFTLYGSHKSQHDMALTRVHVIVHP